ncbi:glycosyltransferase family 25 protein [Neorhodopirellula pilleata]|uniref:Glycosyltransferase family 25 (LPS biosynthesis protein) n=1 Tax=Neorhodopirellula pilleata TaxID=2714738 RepID=A0A5C5ZGV4_9BACT|nr:glycosyltransferase family 25 protein [Neorhodopirellula pilleata]TWT86345.1 Glycosyltransferase family 25 (LPS biosynthesis protein) [Neorhodopirellula pilleata]
MHPITGFVITLRRASARKAQVDRIVANCPVDCQIVDAVDGRELSQAEFENVYCPNLHRPRYPFELNRGEVGCFLSHRRLWQRMIDQNLPQALIIEDDVDFEPTMFSASLAFAREHAIDGDYVQFQVRPLKGTAHLIATDGNVRMVCPEITPLRTSAQLVTLGAAARLLQATARFDRPVDAFLQMQWLTGVRMTAVDPSNVQEISQQIGGSTIGSRRRTDLFQKLRHEVVRPIYRYQIAALSRRHAAA